MTLYQRTIYLLTTMSIILQPAHAYNFDYRGIIINISLSFVVSLSGTWWCNSNTITTCSYVHAFINNNIHFRKSTFLPSLQDKLQQESLNSPSFYKKNNRKHFELYSIITTPQNQEESSLNEYDDYSNQPVPNAIPSPTEQSNLRLSDLEKEFYSMMADFTLYTPQDIATIPNPSYRALYNGVLAGSNEPHVMNAFAIIFNDLLPIRIAGRMIYKHLKSVMDENIQLRKEEDVVVMNETGLSMDAIENGRKTFMCALNSVQDSAFVDSSNEKKNGGRSKQDGMLTMTELIDSGIVDMIVEVMQYDSFDAFVQRMEQDENEKFNFESFMIGLQKCALMKNSSSKEGEGEYDDGVLCDMSCDLEEVLLVTSQRMAPMDARKNEMTISQRKQKYSHRYDEMVKTFEEWESIMVSSNNNNDGAEKKEVGRMGQVLAGCFAGAKNERIVYALKIVYMDYSALRVGGDLVFKLMKKVVNRKK